MAQVNSAQQRRELFERNYAEHARAVWAVAYGHRLDSELAMDVMQETFTRYWKEISTGVKIENSRAWLLRVARNLAMDVSQSAFQRHRTTDPHNLTWIDSPKADAQDVLEKDEVFAKIRRVLLELSHDDRELLTWRYSLDYEPAKIAELLDIPVSSVYMRLSRARQRLADRLTILGVKPLT